MIEERRKTKSAIVSKIKEGGNLCTKAIDKVSTTWELLMEDETAKFFAKEARHAKLKITTVKVNMKKLPIKEII